MWTRFMDMHSGGGNKEGDCEYIYIEAAEEAAKFIFYNRFGHNPERVTCTCCGDDYSISDAETLEMVSAYDRGCEYPKGSNGYDLGTAKVSIADYSAREDVLVIPAAEIKPEEKLGVVPEQGYVWR